MCFWEAVEACEGRELELSELCQDNPLRINGDDILFPCTDALAASWENLLPVYGFEKSLGKNLFLKKAFTINSVYYTCSREGVERQPYLNLGFLNGVKKGDGANDTVSRATQMGEAFDEYVFSRDFWSSASEALTEISSVKRDKIRENAISVYRSTYAPYLYEHGWSFEQWKVSHSLMALAPDTESPLGDTIGEFCLPERPWETILEEDVRRYGSKEDAEWGIWNSSRFSLDRLYIWSGIGSFRTVRNDAKILRRSFVAA
jgi:hypothetical protein